MAKARRVRGLHPGSSTTATARRVVRVRLNETLEWRESLRDAGLEQELHDLRIAVKRLRYAFEIFEPCLPGAKSVLRDLTEIQESIGSIHDLDVLLLLLHERLVRLDERVLDTSLDLARSEGSPEARDGRLRELLTEQSADPVRLGLLGLIGEKTVQRAREYEALQQRWGGQHLDDLTGRIQEAASLGR